MLTDLQALYTQGAAGMVALRPLTHPVLACFDRLMRSKSMAILPLLTSQQGSQSCSQPGYCWGTPCSTLRNRVTFHHSTQEMGVQPLCWVLQSSLGLVPCSGLWWGRGAQDPFLWITQTLLSSIALNLINSHLLRKWFQVWRQCGRVGAHCLPFLIISSKTLGFWSTMAKVF